MSPLQWLPPPSDKNIKIGINGFGRIGRLVARVALQRDDQRCRAHCYQRSFHHHGVHDIHVQVRQHPWTVEASRHQGPGLQDTSLWRQASCCLWHEKP